MRIGYLGLGAMGGSLARHLLGTHELVVHDLNPAALAQFAALGAMVANSPAELARTCDVVLLCLPRSRDVETALFGPGGVAEAVRPGQVVIDQTSGEPFRTAAFATRLAEAGGVLMDAPLSGGIPAAHNRKVLVMASGPDAGWSVAAPVLRVLSDKVMHCGRRVGDGQGLKLLTNAIGACYRLATLELAAVGRRFGLPLAAIVEALNAGAGANFTSRNMMVGMVEGRSTTNFAMSLMVKDLNGAVDLGMRAGCPTPLIATARGLMQASIGLFGTETKLDDVIRLVETLAQVDFSGDGAASALPDGVTAEMVLADISAAALACNLVALDEAVGAGLRLGYERTVFRDVVEAGSSWCAAAAEFFAADALVALRRAHAVAGEALGRMVSLGALAGVPVIMPALGHARWQESSSR